MPHTTGRTALGLIGLGGFILLAYLPSFGVPFVFDDAPNIVFNPRVQPNHIGELWAALDARGAQDRPVAMLSFALNYLAAGLQAPWYHAVNLAIHFLNTGLLFALVLLLARAPLSPPRLHENAARFALAVALLWALHPVNTQAVTYIVQRMASLAATFYLLGLLCFVLWRSGRLSGRWAGPGFAAALLAGLGTKEHVATLPAAALLIDVALFSGLRRVHKLLLPALLAVGAGIVLVYAGADLFKAPAHRDFSGIERLMTQGRVICHYLTLLVWPYADRLQLDYDFVISRSLLDPPSTLIAAGFLFAVSVAALLGLRRAPWPAMGWLFFLLALSVESSVIPLELAFEHRLYLPATLLIAGALAPLFTHFTGDRALRSLSLAVIVVAGLLAWQTLERNRQWQDLGRFWSAELERGASPYRAALNGGIGFLRAGEGERALALFELLETRGLAKTDHQRAKVAQLKGEAHFSRGEFRAALTGFRRALELWPGWTRAAYFAGLALLQLDRPDAARQVLEQLQALDPDSIFAVSLAAQLRATTGPPGAGIEQLHRYLAGAPEVSAINRSFLQLQLGNMYRNAGDRAAAARHYRLALEASDDNWAARSALAALARGPQGDHAPAR